MTINRLLSSPCHHALILIQQESPLPFTLKMGFFSDRFFPVHRCQAVFADTEVTSTDTSDAVPVFSPHQPSSVTLHYLQQAEIQTLYDLPL